MSVKKISIGGIITLVVLFFIFCGTGPTWNLIKNIASGVWKLLIFLPQFIKPFIPFLEIEDIAVSLFIFSFVLTIASVLGIYVSRRCESKLWTAIFGIVGIVSIITTISSGVQM